MIIRLCLAAALLLGVFSTPTYAASSFIGINTNEAVNFDASVPFADLFHTSEPFADSSYTKGNIQYDGNGWVRNLNGGQAGTYIIRWMPFRALPAGNYTVTYEGSGKIEYKESVKLVQHEEGKDLIQFTSPSLDYEISAALVITQSDPKNPIRNIRVFLPGGICAGNPYEQVNSAAQCGGKQFLPFADNADKIVFNPDYLNFMRQFRTLRFMNMSGITRNDIQAWQQRPKITNSTWGGKEGRRGVPLEIMVQLANELNANAWFNLPHRANDDFIRQYATYVRDNLKPNLKVYIEYTNEGWNDAFKQTQYIRQQGKQLQLDKDPVMAGIKFYAQRARQIFQTWEQVFGGTQRLVRVIGGWSGRPDLTPYFLKSADVYKFTDAFAIAPYFYADQKDIKTVKSVNDVFNLVNGTQRYGIDAILKQVKIHSDLIKPYKVDLVAYEGGQHLIAIGTHSRKDMPNPYLSDANRDPRMEQAYVKLLQGFKQNAGQLFVAFSSPRPHAFYGFWGIKEYIRQPDNLAPKVRALQRF